MGSFNETCAISGLPIVINDPVKLVFLTSSPLYCRSLLGRGCNHHDHFSLRTPAISGIYDDYGKCKFEKNPLVDFIVGSFSKDVVEMPFGFNQCHDLPVPENPNIYQLLEAAWEGRLFVTERLGRTKSSNFHTWKDVRQILIDNKIKIRNDENSDGYNVQQLEDGICFVHHLSESYKDSKKMIKNIEGLFSENFDTRFVESHQKYEHGFLVMPKGSIENPEMILDKARECIANTMKNPNSRQIKYAEDLKVYAVMIRQDVWDVYKNAEYEISYRPDFDFSLEGISKKLHEFCQNIGESKKAEDPESEVFVRLQLIRSQGEFNRYFSLLPGVVTIGSHFCDLMSNLEIPEEQKDQLVEVFVETAKVDLIKRQLHESWYIPTIPGQEPEWELRKHINSEFGKIIDKKIQEYKEA